MARRQESSRVRAARTHRIGARSLLRIVGAEGPGFPRRQQIRWASRLAVLADAGGACPILSDRVPPAAGLVLFVASATLDLVDTLRQLLRLAENGFSQVDGGGF